MELLQLWQILWRRKGSLLGGFLLVALTVCLGAQWLPRIYVAKAQIYYKKSEAGASLLASLWGQRGPAATLEENSKSRVTLASTRWVLEEVAARLQLRNRQGVLTPPDARAGLFQRRLQAGPFVKFSPVAETSYVEIEARAGDPDQAAMVANTVATLLIEKTRDQVGAEYRQARAFVEREIGRARAQYLETARALSDFNAREGLVNPLEETRVAVERMSSLLQEKKDVEAQEAGLLTEKTREHPDVVAVHARLVRLETEIARQADALAVRPKKAFAQSQLSVEATVHQTLYTTMLTALQQIGIAEALIPSEIRVVDAARPPEQPKGKFLIYFLGLFLGLCGGFTLAFVREHLDDTVRGPEAEAAADAPWWACIPRACPWRGPLITHLPPHHPRRELYRLLRQHLQVGRPGRWPARLVITSALPGAGKTTTVLNLAQSLAGLGKQVLLVDAHLRQPRLHRLLRLAAAPGFADLLTASARVEECLRPTPIEGLCVLPAGTRPTDAAGLIDSDALPAVMSELCARFDVVIVDSPALSVSHDAAVLARQTDGVVLVVEGGREPRAALHQARAQLRHAQVTLLGLVLNKAPAC